MGYMGYMGFYKIFFFFSRPFSIDLNVPRTVGKLCVRVVSPIAHDPHLSNVCHARPLSGVHRGREPSGPPQDDHLAQRRQSGQESVARDGHHQRFLQVNGHVHDEHRVEHGGPVVGHHDGPHGHRGDYAPPRHGQSDLGPYGCGQVFELVRPHARVVRRETVDRVQPYGAPQRADRLQRTNVVQYARAGPGVGVAKSWPGNATRPAVPYGQQGTQQ